MFNILKNLINIHSVTESEKEITNWIERFLQDCKGEIIRYKKNVVWKSPRFSSDKQTIALVAHTDTVPYTATDWVVTQPTEALEKDGKIYGRGAVDMKAGGAIALDVIRSWGEDSNPNINLVGIFYEGEETPMPNGITALLDAKIMPKIDFAIVLEPTDGLVNNGVFTSVDFDLVATGTSVHSSIASTGSNAIYNLLPAIEQLRSLELKSYSGISESLSINKISSGIARNIVPDQAIAGVDFRVGPTLSREDVLTRIGGFRPNVSLQNIGWNQGFYLDKKNTYLQKFTASVGGQLVMMPFWTDAAQFTNSGIPAINYGPGPMRLSHQVDEYVEMESMKVVRGKLIEFIESME